MADPYSVPNDLQNRMAALFSRMATRGLTETFTVYARAPLVDPVSGRAVGRERVALGAFHGWAPGGGGTETVNQEAQRTSATLEVYAALTPALLALLDATTYPQRWLTRGTEDSREWRITSWTPSGPYVTLMLETGSTSDAAGHVR